MIIHILTTQNEIAISSGAVSGPLIGHLYLFAKDFNSPV